MTATARKSDQVAALIRARIVDGSLRAGMYVPSGAELAKETGFTVLTCRRGLQALFREDVLMQMARTTRYRVAGARPRTASSSHTRWLSVVTRPASHSRSSPARSAGPSRRSATPRRAAVAVPPVLAARRPGAESRRRPARPVRRVAGRVAARPNGGRARHDDHARSARRGQDRHHAFLRPGARYGQVGCRVGHHGAARSRSRRASRGEPTGLEAREYGPYKREGLPRNAEKCRDLSRSDAMPGTLAEVRKTPAQTRHTGQLTPHQTRDRRRGIDRLRGTGSTAPCVK
jgi:DNA-binding transcriptional regulator YhcF (GntR family)